MANVRISKEIIREIDKMEEYTASNVYEPDKNKRVIKEDLFNTEVYNRQNERFMQTEEQIERLNKSDKFYKYLIVLVGLGIILIIAYFMTKTYIGMKI